MSIAFSFDSFSLMRTRPEGVKEKKKLSNHLVFSAELLVQHVVQ